MKTVPKLKFKGWVFSEKFYLLNCFFFNFLKITRFLEWTNKNVEVKVNELLKIR